MITCVGQVAMLSSVNTGAPAATCSYSEHSFHFLGVNFLLKPQALTLIEVLLSPSLLPSPHSF